MKTNILERYNVVNEPEFLELTYLGERRAGDRVTVKGVDSRRGS